MADADPRPTLPRATPGVITLALLAVLPQIASRCSSPPQRNTRPALLPLPGADAGSLIALPQGAITFTTTAALDDVRRYYATTLAAQGWRVGADGLPYDCGACPYLALRLTGYGQEDGRTTYRVGMDERPCTVPPG